jgi:hypothetical protein
LTYDIFGDTITGVPAKARPRVYRDLTTGPDGVPTPSRKARSIYEGIVMNKKSAQSMRYAMLLAIGLTAAGCERIGVAPTDAPATNTIPASFGDLVAVTPTDRRFESVLWFKQSDQTIVAVRVDARSGAAYVFKTKYPRSKSE